MKSVLKLKQALWKILLLLIKNEKKNSQRYKTNKCFRLIAASA